MSQEKGSKRIPKYDKRRIYKECSRKKGFNTTKEANQQIRRILERKGVKLNYYQCYYCGKYHLTKKFVKSAFGY